MTDRFNCLTIYSAEMGPRKPLAKYRFLDDDPDLEKGSGHGSGALARLVEC